MFFVIFFKYVMSIYAILARSPYLDLAVTLWMRLLTFPRLSKFFFFLSATPCACLPDSRAPERSSGYDAEGGSAHVGIRFVELVTFTGKDL